MAIEINNSTNEILVNGSPLGGASFDPSSITFGGDLNDLVSGSATGDNLTNLTQTFNGVWTHRIAASSQVSQISNTPLGLDATGYFLADLQSAPSAVPTIGVLTFRHQDILNNTLMSTSGSVVITTRVRPIISTALSGDNTISAFIGSAEFDNTFYDGIDPNDGNNQALRPQTMAGLSFDFSTGVSQASALRRTGGSTTLSTAKANLTSNNWYWFRATLAFNGSSYTSVTGDYSTDGLTWVNFATNSGTVGFGDDHYFGFIGWVNGTSGLGWVRFVVDYMSLEIVGTMDRAGSTPTIV